MLILLLVAGACDPETSREALSSSAEDAIVRLEGEGITLRELGIEEGATADARQRAIDRAILRRLAAAEARRRGLDAEAELGKQLLEIERDARIRQESLLRDALFARIRDALVLSDDALRTHYETTKLRYAERQLRLRRWSFGSREAAERALGEGAALDEATAESIGLSSVRELPRAVLPEALRLERPGERTVAGSDEEGWSLVELAEVLPAEPRPFEAVRADVEASLRQMEAMAAFRALLAELRAKADVRVDSEALARMGKPGDAHGANERRQPRSTPR